MNASKKNVALQAIDLLKTKLYPEMILGIGTGSTVNAFIDDIDQIANYFSAAVSSSNASTSLLRDKGINVLDLNDVNEIHFYIDGADEVDPNNFLIKGGGGAHTKEKIIASASNKFICLVDESKRVSELGSFPLPIEVLPMSRSLVSRTIVSMGGVPIYRNGFITDHQNHIIDVTGLDFSDPSDLEKKLNAIPGVVDNGVFARNKPDLVIFPKD